jgi:fructan beta-fructosidase
MLPNQAVRPHYHFTPPSNWMNDPNGLVYYRGEYHLFYQYHPDSVIWGPMHWGHAVSRDLTTWEHLPIALYPDNNGTIFSGSAVIDWQNTTGFGKEAMVAIFTHDRSGIQSQSLAYSLDAGRTWTKYPGNPVLSPPNNLPNFRDPKVFWYGKPYAGHWVMSLAADNMILFYTSPDLTHWTASGRFGPGFGSASSVWETPDLFELSVKDTLETRWVLTVGVQDGGPAGGSATQYFVGTFDGTIFTSENPKETIRWADFGADYYAAQSWNDEPNGRRLMLGWMSNWRYANVTPSTTWRGMFSLPRELALTQAVDGLRLVQQPIPELMHLRSGDRHWQHVTILPEENILAGLSGESFEIVADFLVDNRVETFGFRVRVGNEEETIIAYSPRKQKVFLDRSRSGQSDFHPGFAGTYYTDLALINGYLRLHIFVDQFSVEVFVNEGLVTFSASIFPSTESLGIELFSIGGPIQLFDLDFYQL